MQIRSPGQPDEPDDSHDDGPAGPTPPTRPAEPRPQDDRIPGAVYGPDGSVTFRVANGVMAAKFILAGLLVLVALFVGGRIELIIGLVAAAGVAAYGLRDVLGRDRLRADPNGVRVWAGFSGHRNLAWSDLERVRVEERTRLGVRNDLLELDAGEHIYLLSRYDLGADPQDALTALTAVAPGQPG